MKFEKEEGSFYNFILCTFYQDFGKILDDPNYEPLAQFMIM